MLLFDWWYGKRLTDDDLRRAITQVWRTAEWPERVLGKSTWVEMFRTTGFVCDDPDRGQPNEPLRAYRGTTWGRRRGMAWTEDPDQAAWFAARWNTWGTGHAIVFETTVDPAAVLALIGMPDGGNESEVVVDPTLLPPLPRSSIRAPHRARD